jgi:hypothetical protein
LQKSHFLQRLFVKGRHRVEREGRKTRTNIPLLRQSCSSQRQPRTCELHTWHSRTHTLAAFTHTSTAITQSHAPEEPPLTPSSYMIPRHPFPSNPPANHPCSSQASRQSRALPYREYSLTSIDALPYLWRHVLPLRLPLDDLSARTCGKCVPWRWCGHVDGKKPQRCVHWLHLNSCRRHRCRRHRCRRRWCRQRRRRHRKVRR